jgi:hypothetical protein
MAEILVTNEEFLEGILYANRNVIPKLMATMQKKLLELEKEGLVKKENNYYVFPALIMELSQVFINFDGSKRCKENSLKALGMIFNTIYETYTEVKE